VEHGRLGGIGRRHYIGGSGAAGQGRGPACVTWAVLTGVGRCGLGPGVVGATPTGVRHGATGAVVANARLCGSGLGVVRAEAAACMVAMQEREREKREKERAGSGTIPADIRRANTSANEHKQAGLCGGRGALCLSATR
jgi:hypothetical protein